MNAGDREAWLRGVITRVSGKPVADTGLKEGLQEVIGLGSLGRLEVLAAIEDEFDFFFDDNDLIRASTIARTLDAIERKLAETAGAEA